MLTCLRRRHGGGDGKVLRGGKAVDSLLRLGANLRSDHHGAHIPHIVGYGETEEEHQHHRDAEEDEHGAAVAQNVAGLLDDKREEWIHCVFFGEDGISIIRG